MTNIIAQSHIKNIIHWDVQSIILACLSATLTLYIAFAFSDGVNFIVQFSTYALYGLYLVVFGSVAGCILFNTKERYHFIPTGVYIFWLGYYFLWGLLVSKEVIAPFSETIRTLVRDLTILLAVPVALRQRRHITTLANWMQVAVLINAAICIWEYIDPTVLWAIAELRAEDISVVDPNRAAGLWYNPNPAAFGFLLGALMSYWSRGPLAWVARIAALVGIYLTVSRSGLYLLLLCGIVYGLFQLRTFKITLRHWSFFCCGAALLVGIALISSTTPTRSSGADVENWNVQRLLDVKEDNSDDISRVTLSKVALEAALQGPWYGLGLFSFQGAANSPFKQYTDVGAHNIYIAVLGETGVPGILGFAAVLAFGIWQTLHTPMLPNDRLVLGLLWVVYLFIGFVNHNQFTSFLGTIYAALIFHLPVILKNNEVIETDAHGKQRITSNLASTI